MRHLWLTRMASRRMEGERSWARGVEGITSQVWDGTLAPDLCENNDA
jgi:hypothetical protein